LRLPAGQSFLRLGFLLLRCGSFSPRRSQEDGKAGGDQPSAQTTRTSH
jgi:hypothetical protein